MAHNRSSLTDAHDRAEADDNENATVPERYAQQNRKQSLTVDEAIKMLGERVVQLRVYEREPLVDIAARTYGLRHRAVVCKTDTGNEYLLHNGPGGCGHSEGDAVILPLKSSTIEEEHWLPAQSDEKSEAEFNSWMSARDGVTMSKVKAAASSTHFNKLTYNCGQVVKHVLESVLPKKPPTNTTGGGATE